MSAWNPVLFTGGDRQHEQLNDRWDQITIFWIDEEPPDPDDYSHRSQWLTAWQQWEQQHPDLSAAI